jgi:hypothetical protein
MGLSLAAIVIALGAVIAAAVLSRRERATGQAMVSELETRLRQQRLDDDRRLTNDLTNAMVERIEQERRSRQEEITTRHEETVAEVALMIEELLANVRTDIAWQVAATLEQADRSRPPAQQ